MRDSQLNQKILTSLFYKNKSFNMLHYDTGISKRILRPYLDNLKKAKMITERKQGQHKLSSLTGLGKVTVFNNSLNANLKNLVDIISGLRTSEAREDFKNTLAEKLSNYQTDVAAEVEDFMASTKRSLASVSEQTVLLQLYLYFGILNRESVEKIHDLVKNDYFVFSPGMELFCWWKPGEWSEIEKELTLGNLVKRESEKKTNQ